MDTFYRRLLQYYALCIFEVYPKELRVLTKSTFSSKS